MTLCDFLQWMLLLLLPLHMPPRPFLATFFLILIIPWESRLEELRVMGRDTTFYQMLPFRFRHSWFCFVIFWSPPHSSSQTLCPKNHISETNRIVHPKATRSLEKPPLGDQWQSPSLLLSFSFFSFSKKMSSSNFTSLQVEGEMTTPKLPAPPT